jgi:hypothetical protein
MPVAARVRDAVRVEEQTSRPGLRPVEGLRQLADPIVVRVVLESSDGDCRLTIAYGETLERALESALRTAPAQKSWWVAGWNAHSV